MQTELGKIIGLMTGDNAIVVNDDSC